MWTSSNWYQQGKGHPPSCCNTYMHSLGTRSVLVVYNSHPPLATYMYVCSVTWFLSSSCCSEPQCAHVQFSPFYYLSTLDITHVRKLYQALCVLHLCATENGTGLGTRLLVRPSGPIGSPQGRGRSCFHLLFVSSGCYTHKTQLDPNDCVQLHSGRHPFHGVKGSPCWYSWSLRLYPPAFNCYLKSVNSDWLTQLMLC